MIYLQSGSNNVTVTLAEKSSLTQSYYTWQLIRKGTFDNVIFYQDDISSVPYYWNEFQITVANYSGLTAGIIQVNPGEWTYNVYEMSTPYDLNLTNTVGLVETGICIISGTSTSNSNYTGTNDNTITYYQNI